MSNIVNCGEYLQTRKTNASDPLVILHWLRETGRLTLPYYLHIDQDCAEIGWQAKAYISHLDGQPIDTDEWVSAIKQIGDQAAVANNKAFGYLGFDAWDRAQGFAPDKSASFPLLQFFIPEHRICIRADRIEYRGTDTRLFDKIARLPPASSPPTRHHAIPDKQFSEQAFMEAVATAKQSLSENLTKVVLSRYMGFDYDADLLALFADYCLQQKFSDAVLMDFGVAGAAIASPELLLKIDSGRISANPLGGSRVWTIMPKTLAWRKRS